MSTHHFLTLFDYSANELQALIDRAIEIKQWLKSGKQHSPLLGKNLAMLFEKSSTRTRISFETGMAQLGGSSLFLSSADTQMGRGEPIKDSARVISSMVDGVMIRTHAHKVIEEFAEYSAVPVINALTDDYHPCQLLADIMTFQELRGSIKGATVAWIGDGNNMCQSFMNAAELFGFTLNIACPDSFLPKTELINARANNIVLCDSPKQAATDVDLLVTDTWTSMGQEEEKAIRMQAFEGFCVDDNMLKLANKDALFMHCLPAYRGFETTDAVIEGPQSAVFQEAENRLHAQKALLEDLLS